MQTTGGHYKRHFSTTQRQDTDDASININNADSFEDLGRATKYATYGCSGENDKKRDTDVNIAVTL